MQPSFSALEDLLDHFEKQQQPITESNIYDALCRLPESKGDNPSPELLAERMAFGFMEDAEDKKSGWGTYFGPMMVYQDKDGTWFETPSLKAVTKEILEYWAHRARATKHPILRARYGDLVWELAPHVNGTARDAECARLAIGAIIEMSREPVHQFEHAVSDKLIRALSLALSLGDAALRRPSLQFDYRA